MNFSNKIKFAICGISPLIVSNVVAKTNNTQTLRPNILVVLCDDLGYSDVGFNGSKDIKTPVLDDLANHGTIFSSAYVAHPFSGPSRASIMTGRYSQFIGAPFNLSDDTEDIREGVPVTETFISKVLQKSGYYTSAIGKWHLGYDKQFQPNSRGFDDFYGFLGGGHNYFPKQYKTAYQKQLNVGKKNIFVYITPLLHNREKANENDEYITDNFSHQAIRVVNEAAEMKKPFFMYLAYNAPHVPLEAKEEDMAKFSEIKDIKRRTFAAMVYAVDRGVGEIVKTLKANHQFENTLIVFLSDNGANIEHGGTNFPLKGTKGDTWEGGYRVPMFFHWPNVIPSGKRFDYPVSSLDFYPTFTKLAGGKIPKGKILDGKDIWNDVITGKNPRKGQMIYAVRYRNGFTDVGARKDDWKIVKFFKAPWKLFNITEDISERNDLSAKYPEKVEQMVSETEKWSRGHVTPLWFNTEKEKIIWFETGMPNYKETFKLP
ncbi:MAG: sulfatase-like hydrolase/transferase [Bacteroidales bacterium]